MDYKFFYNFSCRVSQTQFYTTSTRTIYTSLPMNRLIFLTNCVTLLLVYYDDIVRLLKKKKKN